MFTRLAAFLVVCGLTAPAAASPITGAGPLGQFTGDLSYNPANQTVTVALTNAPTTAPGGKITGFVFNLPAGATITNVAYAGTNPNFVLMGAPAFANTVSANPHGDFDLGAALGGDFEGGGSPNAGIPVGGSATFTFQLTGAGLAAVTTADFFAARSANTTADKDEAFVVRFRGFDGGGSDKVPLGGGGGGGGGTETRVPEPGTLLVVGLLGGLSLLGRRLRATPA